MGRGNLRASVKTLTAPIHDRDNLKCEGFATSVEVSEGVDLLHVSFWVQSMNPGRDPAVWFVPQFHFLRVDRPRGLITSLSTLSLGLLLESGWSTTCTALLLGSFRHHR